MSAAEPAARRARVLVVEDEANQRDMLAALLGRAGYDVETAENGAAGLLRLDAARFDLVLSDQRMAGVGGLALLAQVRGRDPELPVVLMTAYGSAATEQEARRHFAQGSFGLGTGTVGRGDEPVRWVVGADTVVVVDDVIFGKPADPQEAREMLVRLSGREHLVISGFCLFDLRRNREGLQAVTTVVKFKDLTRSEIDQYVSVGESMDKAGAYAVQGVGAYLVEYLHGSYTNVVGLPLCQVIEMMEEMGARDVLPWGAREPSA